MWFLTKVKRQDLPQKALLNRYQDSGNYTDCFTCLVNQPVTQAELIQAFYCTWLFKLERKILAIAVKRPSNDSEAAALAQQSRDRFSAWQVEQQNNEQLLMCDFEGRTRHWLMAEQHSQGSTLYFGSAVIKGGPNHSIPTRLIFGALGGFHIVYSRLLLSAAANKVSKQ